MPKFQVYKDSAGKFRFRLRADNNSIVAIGEAYEQYGSCINGIKSLQKNCKAQVEDVTVEGQRLSNPKFQIYTDTAGKYRFRLYARNGEIIADSEGYETKDACLNGIEVVGQSGDAEIVDLTESQESIAAKAENILPDSKKQEFISTTMTSSAAETKTSQVISTTEHEVIALDKEDQMLEELKKIRVAVEKPPEPTPPHGLWNEFKDFLSKYKILGLAVAFVLGLYLGAVVQALITSFIMPLIGLAIPGLANLATLKFGIPSTTFDASGHPPAGYAGQIFSVGDFLVALITFVIVAFIVFLVVKIAKRWKID